MIHSLQKNFNLKFYLLATILLIIQPFMANSQKQTFKSNLFNDADITVEIQNISNYILLEFRNKKEIKKDSIYNWTTSLLESVFEKNLKDSSFKALIPIEANRIFDEFNLFKEEATKIDKTKTSINKLVAGTLGFENKTVYLSNKQEITKKYRNEINEAKKNYKNSTKNHKNKNFNQPDSSNFKFTRPYKILKFIKPYKISDTRLNSKVFLNKTQLKKKNTDKIEQYLINKIENDKNDQSNKKRIDNSYFTNLMKFQIDSIKVEITKTFIENIIAYGKVQTIDILSSGTQIFNQKQVSLRNINPIGISTLNALDENNKKKHLYAIINKSKYSVPLYKVLAFYRPELQSLRRDYSPADTSFTVMKNNSLQTFPLFRESTNELFELKVFSDFTGRKNKNTNGILQTELSKEIYLNPYRWLIRKNQSHSAFWGIFSYIKPSFTLAKIEENNKYYNLNHNNDSSYISTLALKQYEIYNVGFDLNIVMLSLPFLKSNIYLDPGLYFGSSGVADSINTNLESNEQVNKQEITHLTLKANLRFATQSDERYFFETRFFYHRTKLLSNHIFQEPKIKAFTETSFHQKSLIGTEFYAGFAPTKNPNGKIFFRYRYIYSLGGKNGFNQTQIGYSYYFKR